MAKWKIGDKLVFGKGKKNKAFVQDSAIDIGRVYEIAGYDDDGDAYFLSNTCSRRYPSLMNKDECKITRIVD